MKRVMVIALLAIFLNCSISEHYGVCAGLEADDFLPPVQATSDETQQKALEIKQPDAVKEVIGIDGKDAIEAATAQDAVNAAVIKFDDTPGCQQVKFPSGFGWVSTGIGSYGIMPNPTATLMAQRQAYQVAYMNAKKNLAEALYGLSTDGKEQLKQQMTSISTDKENLSNLSESYKENIQEQVQGLLKGYVVYSVKDEQIKNVGYVSVTIVTTPKTMGKGQRMNSTALSTDTIKDGLNAVLAELNNGLTPPVGGRVISVPQTGEIAFIGFGSAIVVSNPNPAAQAKLKVNAQKLAQMRARNALCGIIIGDEISSSSKLDSQIESLNKQFDEIQKEDPLNQNTNSSEIAKLNEQRNTFLSTQMSHEEISSLRKGILPPGVSVKTFFNPENTMAEAVAVYLPSASANAASFGQQMKNSKILQDTNSNSAGNTNMIINKKPTMPSKGASGQVTNDADL